MPDSNAAQLSVSHKQISEKAPQLLNLYLTTSKQESNSEDETELLVCEDMLFYCCENLTAEDLTQHRQIAEELYHVSFLFWGNTEQRIITFNRLPQKLQQTYIQLVKQIQSWIDEGSLPSAQLHGQA